MYVRDEYGVDAFLSSNASYEKKIEELRKEQEYAKKMIGVIDEKIQSFEDGNYIEKMINERINNLRALRNWLATTCVTGIFSGVEICNLQKIEEMINNPETSNKGLALLLAGVVSTGIFVAGAGASIKDSYNEMLYKQRISSYQRRLK